MMNRSTSTPSNKRCSLRLIQQLHPPEYSQYNSNSDDEDSPPEKLRQTRSGRTPRKTSTTLTSLASKLNEVPVSPVKFNFESRVRTRSKAVVTLPKPKKTKVVYESPSSDDEDEEDVSEDFSMSSSGSDEDEVLDKKPSKSKSVMALTPSLTYTFDASLIEPLNPESYLLAQNRQKFKSVKASSDALANDCRKGKSRKPRKGTRGLGGQKIDNLPERLKSNFSATKECLRAFAAIGGVATTKHSEEINAFLENKMKPDFPRWMLLLREGFNVLLHGYGSKLPVVAAFEDYLNDLGDWLQIRVNGLVPKLNPRKAWIDFLDALDLNECIAVKGTNVNVISEEVCHQLPEDHSPVFLIVTNIDSLALNQPNVLNFVCSLAQIRWVYLLATADNVNTCLGMTQSQSIQLNFCWIPCSTFQPYSEELSWTPNIFGDLKGSKGTENTLQYVLKSLTGNARKAFSILASLQLNQLQAIRGKKGKEFSGVEFSVLARKCRESFVAHTDEALKTLLVEFVDHKLVTNHQAKKGGANLLSIDLDLDVLERIVNDAM